MSDLDETAVRRVIKRLVDGERLSILIGDGARPDEIQTARDMTPIRRMLIRDLLARLPNDTPPAGAPAVSIPSGASPQGQAAVADVSAPRPEASRNSGETAVRTQ